VKLDHFFKHHGSSLRAYGLSRSPERIYLSQKLPWMLEEVIKLHRFAGSCQNSLFTETGRHCEAVVAAD